MTPEDTKEYLDVIEDNLRDVSRSVDALQYKMLRDYECGEFILDQCRESISD